MCGVYHVDFPPSLVDMFQERGRAGQIAHTSPEQNFYHVHICLESFLHLFKRIFKESLLCPSYQLQPRDNLFQCLRLLVLPTKCISLSLEEYLAPPGLESHTNPLLCGHCFKCNSTNVFPALCREGVQMFFSISLWKERISSQLHALLTQSSPPWNGTQTSCDWCFEVSQRECNQRNSNRPY